MPYIMPKGDRTVSVFSNISSARSSFPLATRLNITYQYSVQSEQRRWIHNLLQYERKEMNNNVITLLLVTYVYIPDASTL